MTVLVDVPYGPHGERNWMDVYLPEGAGRRPLVVGIHGGGWTGGNLESYTLRSKTLARRGFVAATVTYRFWPDAPCPAAIDDVMRAIRYLRAGAKDLGIDAERVGVYGGSAGGHLAACLGLMDARASEDPALARYGTSVRCVVDEFGPVDLVAMMSCASAPLVEGFLGVPLAGNEDQYGRASPLRHVRPGAPPFLIQHGSLDDGSFPGSVPRAQSESLHRALQAVGTESTLMIFEGAGHGFGGDDAERAWTASTDFFLRHLGPV